MFTGIIIGVGTVLAREGDRITLKLPAKFRMPALGASIACDGVCLTVVKKSHGTIAVDVSPETFKRTTLGEWKKGSKINLEPALKIGDELGGHFVTGHVDAVVTIKKVTQKSDHRVWEIACPKALLPLVAEKGSVTLEGVSLTVNGVTRGGFSINIIPHTLKHTNLSQKNAGDALNLEVDILARYLLRQRNV